MPSSSCHTVLAESFFRRNAELFRPHLAAVGLREQILSAPESEIPVTKYVALWEVLGSEVSPTIGLEVAMRTESSELGAYGHAIRCAPSMQLVLRSLSRFMVVLTQATQLDFEDNGKRISLAYRVTDASIVQRRQDAEFTICTILNLLREVTRNPQLSPVRVDFEHRAPSDLASHREVFGCPIRFEQPDNRLYFSRELLDMPIRTADQRLFQALEPFLEQQRQSRAASTDVLSQVAHHIASSLSSGCASLEQVASDLEDWRSYIAEAFGRAERRVQPVGGGCAPLPGRELCDAIRLQPDGDRTAARLLRSQFLLPSLPPLDPTDSPAVPPTRPILNRAAHLPSGLSSAANDFVMSCQACAWGRRIAYPRRWA